MSELPAWSRATLPLSRVAICLGVVAAGCGEPSPAADAGPDAQLLSPDSGPPDDASAPTPDAGATFSLSFVEPDGPITAAGGDVPIRVFVDGAAPELVNLRLDMAPLVSLSAPFEHVLSLDELEEGVYELVAEATVDGQTASSEPLTLTVDRSGPRVTAVEPGTSELYRLGSAVTVTFDEPLDPASVMEPSTGLVTDRGTRLSSRLELDEDGMVLTITPLPTDMIADTFVELALGVADPAGNAVVPFEATWQTPRWLPVGGEVFRRRPGESYADENLEVLRDGSGQVLVAALIATGAGTHHVRVARFDGSAWTELGDGACEGSGILPPFTDPLGAWDFALEPDDTPVVAVRDIEDPSSPLARFCRFDGARWDAESESLPVTDLREVSFAIDASGTRVLGASIVFSGREAERRPQTWRKTVGGAWTRLGSTFSPVHDREQLFEVEFDRMGRLNELHVQAGFMGPPSRWLTHRDMFGNVVQDVSASGSVVRGRLAETSASRAMLAGCTLVEEGPTSPTLFSLSSSDQCDIAVDPVGERRVLVYRDTPALGLAVETGPGTFEDLGPTAVHVSAGGGVCFPPVDGCRHEARAAFTAFDSTGRVLALVHSGFDVRSFELHATTAAP